jgi:uncharacterized phage protein (TIGR01671 family)
MKQREIEFRAWDSDFKLMLYEFTDDGYSVDMQYGKLVVGSYDGNDDYFELPLMQFTGLLDKNGNKCFDGDIVKLNGWGRTSVNAGYTSIIWDIDVIGWNFENSNYAEDRYDFRKAVSHCEVVGNIYETPELLEP